MRNIQHTLLSAFESSGLTYDELAKLANVPKSALYRYLNGDTEKIPIDRFQAICDVLHIDASMLLGWSDETAEPPDKPRTHEARIVSGSLDRMPPEARQRALQLLSLAFSEYFKEDPDHDA